ncbi:3-hydroxyisobutyrate dehydrogenase [Rhizobium sp. PP-F2F-G48]|uniref:NAD(P)-dependent oxidoreductase n=1 Tax=Rhizobium sp. PP-F2F-G48 TaxID=2135651 RepID=UPI00104BBA53|nr:NAD(P)-dependent oxidoreductase [Rhizobium sp. PP-F2F-G48]TCM46521.1 3-hydroxyisobutyrate dehydrogenase [Rhizobium sp. PP-F2F-G48]
MRIGFIGLGLMGKGMAGGLQSAGYDLVVHDLAPEVAKPFIDRGALWAGAPSELAEMSEIIFTSLPGPSESEAVAFGKNGLWCGLKSGSVWFDLTTNSVEVVRSLHAKMAERNVSYFDAPVSGGPRGAATGQLAIWASGDYEVYLRCEPVLKAFAERAQYVGEVGSGTITKLVHNAANAAVNAIMAEVLTMGVKAGLEPATLWRTIRTGVIGRMRTFDNVGNRFLQGRLDPPHSALTITLKDVGLALEIGRENNVPMRICNLVYQDIAEAINRGWSNRDSQSFLVLQQERAGVPPFAISAEHIAEIVAAT